jgi:predicted Ser/Thr protein kinase
MALQELLEALSAPDRQTVEAWLVAFDQHWHDGKLDAHAAALPPPPSALRLPALVEMVKIDLERQWQHGNRVPVQAYRARFPELASGAVAAELARAEARVQRQFGVAANGTPGGEPATLPNGESHPLDEVAGATWPQPGPGRGAEIPWRGPSDRYCILRKIGQGNMGAVYLARDTVLGRPVALKVPHFRPEDGPEVRERFLREARLLAALRHPNLCPVFDAGVVDGVPFLAMAYLEGSSLAQRLRAGPSWPQRAAAALVHRLALALAEAHDRGIIHRDLKPANIILTNRDEPVVIDFGLARSARPDEARLTGTGAILGTPAYMAPEQAAGEVAALGPACDIYSLGVILYELLAGRLPFEGSPLEVLARIRAQPPAPVSAHRPDVDPALDAVCRRALAKRPADRYRDMRALADALAAYLRADAPPPARPRPAWRGRLGWAGALLVLAGLCGIAWYGFRGNSAAPDLAPALNPGPAAAQPAPPAAAPPWVEVRRFKGHGAEVIGGAFAGGGEVLSGGADRTVRFWDVSTGEEKPAKRWQFDELTHVRAVSPDGRLVLTSTMQGLTLWAVAGRKSRPQVNPGSPHIDAVALSPDGRRFLAGIQEPLVGPVLRAWDLDTDRVPLLRKELPLPITCVAVAPNGRYSLSGSQDGLRVWDVSAGTLLHHLRIGPVAGLAFSPDGGRFLAAAQDTVRLGATETGADLGRLDGHDGAALALAFSPDGNHALTGGEDGTVRLWDPATRKELACLRGHGTAVTCLAFSPDGDHALTGGRDGSLRLWGPPEPPR